MRLNEWVVRAGVDIDYDLDGPGTYIDVYADERIPHFKELWSLSDYLVSGRYGPFVRLVPRS